MGNPQSKRLQIVQEIKSDLCKSVDDFLNANWQQLESELASANEKLRLTEIKLCDARKQVEHLKTLVKLNMNMYSEHSKHNLDWFNETNPEPSSKLCCCEAAKENEQLKKELEVALHFSTLINTVKNHRNYTNIPDLETLPKNSEALTKQFQCPSPNTIKPLTENTSKSKYKNEYRNNTPKRPYCKMFGGMIRKNDLEKEKVENRKLKAENVRLKRKLLNNNETSCLAVKLYEKTKNKYDQLKKKLKKKNDFKSEVNKTMPTQNHHQKKTEFIMSCSTETHKLQQYSGKRINLPLNAANLLLTDARETVKELEMRNIEIQNALNIEIRSHKETKDSHSVWIAKLDHIIENLTSNIHAFMTLSENLIKEKDDLKIQLEITNSISRRLGKIITCSYTKENEKSAVQQPESCEKWLAERLLMEYETELTIAKHKKQHYQESYESLKVQMIEKEDKMDCTVSIVEEEAKKLYSSLEEKCKEVEENKKELVKYKAKNYHLMREKMEIQCTFGNSLESIDSQASIEDTTNNKLNQAASLWVAIDQMHLNCLKTSKSTTLVQNQKTMEEKVYQYLSLVPHDQRFCSEQVWEILLLSAHVIPDFSPLRAAKAFKLIENFAANLINLKIRSHSRTEIRKKFIDKNLYGAQKLFMQMGYQFMSTGENILVLDTPVHKDCIISIARDCRIAQTECRIIEKIFRIVENFGQCSWKDVLNCRLRYVGTPEELGNKLIKYKKRHSV